VPPGGVIFEDDFTQRHWFWPVGPSEQGESRYRDEAYCLRAQKAQGIYLVTLREPTRQDLALEVDVWPEEASFKGIYGVGIRSFGSPSNGYFFILSAQGAFQVLDATGTPPRQAVPWTPIGSRFTPERGQHLSVIARGIHLAFLIDGRVVGVAEDRFPHTGPILLVVGSGEAQPSGWVCFDNLRIRSVGPEDELALAKRPTPGPPTPVIPRRATVTVLRPVPTALPIAHDLLKRAHDATVSLHLELPDSLIVGTGTVVGPDGRTMLTAFHVIGDMDTGEQKGGTLRVGPYLDFTLLGNVLAGDREHDLAVVRVTNPDFPGFAIVPLGDSDQVAVGDSVYVLSYPASGQGSLVTTRGVVLTAYRERPNGPVEVILTDAQVSPGSSGGVAIDLQGRVIGIVSAIIQKPEVLSELGYPDLSAVSVLVPVNKARPLLQQVGAW